MYPTPRCTYCGSENHVLKSCTYQPGIKTCEVTIGGVTTKYVLRDDYDALRLVHEALQVAADRQVKDAQMKIAALEHALPRACDCMDRIEAIQRRYEAELDLYRVPPGYTREPCVCGADRHSYHVMKNEPKCTCCAVHVRPMKDVGW